MGNHVALPQDTGAGEVPEDELQSLRSILMGPAEQQLQALQARMDDRFSHAREVGAVLPQAILNRARDPELARALKTPVEHAITAAVRENPQPLAEAIFPIIGPAIRRAVAASLSTMLESFNRTLEYSVSWRAVRWRIEALRTGSPFGEVVLLHTLLYRVEQVFLIHRRSGLLLHHVRAGTARGQDIQMVSAMLTAIRDFVQDSFRVSEHDSLNALQVGELCVWVEQGPSAIVAIVSRGSPPQELRQVLQRAIETIHLQHGDALDAFDGDTQPFESSEPVLHECLQAEYRGAPDPPARRMWALAALVLLALGVWSVFAIREGRQWASYVEALRHEPGLVVISAGRTGGQYRVEGLRDPLARDPDVILRQSPLSPADVVSRWDPYQALSPSFVLARARRALAPAPDTILRLDDDVLTAEGTARAAWIVEARRTAPLVGGVSTFDDATLVASTLSSLTRRIESTMLLFGRGAPELLDGQTSEVAALAADLRELDALGAAAGRAFHVEARGHTDADGASISNVSLSRARAERAVTALGLQPTPHLDIGVTGVGSHEPFASGEVEADKQRNRRVTFRVADAAAVGTRR